jgi:hypothetical protein
MKILSLDFETKGLYGQAHAAALTVRDSGKEVFSWQGRIDWEPETGDWWADKIHSLASIPVTARYCGELEEQFWALFQEHKDGAVVIAHMPHPVESGVFRRCVERDIPGRQWSGPYPSIHDVATLLLLAGEAPDSVDAYAKKYGITCEFNGSPHHPMYDAVIAAQVWEHLYSRLGIKTAPSVDNGGYSTVKKAKEHHLKMLDGLERFWR